jgi:phosphoglycerate dehydrogenase-like enzyme
MLSGHFNQCEELMRRVIVVGLTAFAVLFCTTGAWAEISIEQLIIEAGLREGPIAVRDIPGWRSPQKILIRGNDELVAELQDANPDTAYVSVRSEREAMEQVANADAIVGFCGDRLVAAADELRWVQISWAGVEGCLESARLADGSVLLTNMQKMSSPVIAEHAIALTLSLTRGLTTYAKSMAGGNQGGRSARQPNLTAISGKTMLVAGLGGIGNEVARRAAALGMRVIGTRNSSREGPEYVEYVGLSDELFDLASEADVIVSALPITPATTGLFNKEFFAATKRGVYFVNVGRGLSVVTDDLVAALESGQINGAGLDVTEPEPLPADHVLWQMKNVIITPHMAGRGSARERQSVLLKENLRRYVDGDALLNVVDPERGY